MGLVCVHSPLGEPPDTAPGRRAVPGPGEESGQEKDARWHRPVRKPNCLTRAPLPLLRSDLKPRLSVRRRMPSTKFSVSSKKLLNESFPTMDLGDPHCKKRYSPVHHSFQAISIQDRHLN